MTPHPPCPPHSRPARDSVGVAAAAMFVVLLAGAVAAFPAVRDLSLFRDLFIALCAPFL